MPYPLPKLDMICITEFAAGAMENWGLVTYRENALMVDEATASPQQKQRVAIVVAHELAHQWFGNLVTMAWWGGLWLNEGFAAFMEHFCTDALFPDYKMWEQFTTDAFSSAQRLDALKSSHPVIVPIKHAEEVDQVFDAISYCKGSTVVNMVAAILGECCRYFDADNCHPFAHKVLFFLFFFRSRQVPGGAAAVHAAPRVRQHGDRGPVERVVRGVRQGRSGADVHLDHRHGLSLPEGDLGAVDRQRGGDHAGAGPLPL